MSESGEYTPMKVVVTEMGKRLHPAFNLSSAQYAVPGIPPCFSPAQADVIGNRLTISSNRSNKPHPPTNRISPPGTT